MHQNRFIEFARPLLLFVLLIASVGAATHPSAAAADDRIVNERSYNSDYLFAATRGLRDADMHPAAKVIFAPFTIVFDTAASPVALVMGLFG